MIKKPNFYSVIIGTELLNGRRVDKHFEFLNQELLKRGWEQKANFVIKDEPSFMEDVYKLVKADKNSVMISFGGIGATPDDYTRVAAANVFRDGKMETNKKALKLIREQFGDDAYPYRVNMANLPKNSTLLKNVVNRVPGFGIDDRFFFVPGFPSMAWDMIKEALDKNYAKNKKKFNCNFTVKSSESDIIGIMKELPKDLEFSSLPKIKGKKRSVDIYIADDEKKRVQKWCSFFKKEVLKKKIKIKTKRSKYFKKR